MKYDICTVKGRLLAIDYGTKRVGLAVTDPLALVGTPLATVGTAALFDFLREYCVRESVGLFLLGYPLTLRGEENAWTREVKRIKNRLHAEFPNQPVYLLDERMSSKMASRTLHSLGLSRKQRHNKAHLDSISATILLNNYLQNPHRTIQVL